MVTVSYGRYGQRAASIGQDSIYVGFYFPHQIQFRFSKEGLDYILQNRPGSDLDGFVRFGPNASGLEASLCQGIIGPGFWQDATGPLPVSHFQTRLRSSTDGPEKYCVKPARIQLGSGRLCHVFGQTDPIRKQAGLEDSSGLLLSLLFNSCGHCLVILSLTVNETLKWLSSLPIFMQESFWW